MKYLLSAVFALFFSASVNAHIGEHEAPVSMAAPHGGVMKKAGEVMVEVVAQARQASVYIYDLKLAPRDLTSVKVTASVIKPKSKAGKQIPVKIPVENSVKIPLQISSQNNVHFLTCDFGEQSAGLHRFTLRLAVDDPKTGHAGHVDFTIEP